MTTDTFGKMSCAVVQTNKDFINIAGIEKGSGMIAPNMSTIFGFIFTEANISKDVLTQMKRNLGGFWVAHPDFVRLGMAITTAWDFFKNGDKSKLELLIKGLLKDSYQKEILDWASSLDIEGRALNSSLYARYLMVADLKESKYIANNHPDEIRYNVFQTLQYLTDWLSGNGCVALPATIDGIPVRVMDDLATAERSRWEVWHEIHHGRFSLQDFLKIHLRIAAIFQ
jgi:malate synthase